MKRGLPKEQWLVNFLNKHDLTLGAELGVQKGNNFRYWISGKC